MKNPFTSDNAKNILIYDRLKRKFVKDGTWWYKANKLQQLLAQTQNNDRSGNKR